MNEELETRRSWFDSYVTRCESGKSSPTRKGFRHTCPCCGYLTLQERGGYDICCLCNWEDDGQDDPNADEVRGGPNGDYSLTRARQNFQRELVMYDSKEKDTRIGGPDSAAELDAKRAMIEAFESMITARREDKLQSLWRDVTRAQSVLTAELHRKLKEHEAAHKPKGSV